MNATDTIYALSTPPGRGAIAIIRISGPQTSVILESLAGSTGVPRRFQVRKLVDPSTSDTLDQAVVIWLPAPSTFTGEDCAELQLHASPAVLRALFLVLSRFEEVRLAEPGEFTRRAVRNGRMDLVEAEGLGDLLAAETALQRRQAMSQMLGRASSIFDSWRERLLQIRADIEAVVDFVEEEGVAEAASAYINEQIGDLLTVLEGEFNRSRSAEVVRDGLRIVLAGLPNTGKSSLLNAIAKREAAIVSSVPGTTRDVIEVFLDLDGLPVILADTAGLRDAGADTVEAEGIRRTHERLTEADLVVWVMSPDVPGSAESDVSVVPDLVVQSKSDLAGPQSGLLRNDDGVPVIVLSVKTGEGLTDLTSRLASMGRKALVDQESAVVVGQRQREAVAESIRFLNEAAAQSSDSLELKAEGIRRAADAIARLTGRTEVEEWLGAIFSRFCIGK